MLPESLQLTIENEIKSIAFSSISTGTYRFTVKRAARIAILETSNFLDENSRIEKVLIACFDEGTMEVNIEALKMTE